MELGLPSDTFRSLKDLSWISLWDSKAKRSLADLFLDQQEMDAAGEALSADKCEGKTQLIWHLCTFYPNYFSS